LALGEETNRIKQGGKSEMKYSIFGIAVVMMVLGHTSHAKSPSSFGSGFNVQDYYKPFALEEITPANQQTWPYYKYVSVHWDEYALHGTAKIKRSTNQTKLTLGDDGKTLDLKTGWTDDRSFIESLL